MSSPPGAAHGDHARARFDGHPWDEPLLNTPFYCPASATTVKVLFVPPGACAFVLLVQTPANINSVVVAGVGSGFKYLNQTSTPAAGVFVIQVYPSLENQFTITVVANASGYTQVYASALFFVPGELTGLATSGSQVTAVAGGFADGAITTLGAEADAKNAATDATPITAMQVLKQLSAYGALAALESGGNLAAIAARVPAIGVDRSTTITLGGTAQALAGGTPPNGFEVGNPDPSEDVWVSDSTTAVANGVGCFRVAANGGTFTTPANYRPIGAVSVIAATTGHKFAARTW